MNYSKCDKTNIYLQILLPNAKSVLIPSTFVFLLKNLGHEAYFKI